MTDRDDSTQAVLAAGTRVGRYEIVGPVGSGGMGDVYRAHDVELGREVALKFLPPRLEQDEDARERFRREARAAAKLSHPNIVHVYEVGRFQEQPFIAMELVDGSSLRDVLGEQDFSLAEVHSLGLQLSEGLKEAHRHDVVHRDLKPANVVMGRDGRVRLVDFGLASIPTDEQLTRAGTTVGTVAYMSPEQVRGEAVDGRSDLFSLGVVLYEALSGRAPFRRENDAATMHAILHDSPEPLSRYKSGLDSAVGQVLERVILRLLEKDREHRYQTAGDVAAELKRDSSQSVQAVDKATPSPQSAAAASRPARRWQIRAGALGLLGVVALVIWTLARDSEPGGLPVSGEEDPGHRIAVLNFENLANPDDPARLAQIIPRLLITDLSESKYMQVVSSQRVHDILKQIGEANARVVTADVASRVAGLAKARWMLTGHVLQEDPKLVVTAELVEVDSGDVKASERIVGREDEGVFELVDRITQTLRSRLELPAAAADEPDPRVADVTTHSADAFRLYAEALEDRYRYLHDDAIEKLRAALAIDSTFASAHLELSRVSDDFEESQRHIAAAKQHLESVTWLERNSIEAYDEILNGDIRRAVEIYESILQRDPDHKGTLHALATSQRLMGHHRQSIDAWERLVEVDPTDKEAHNQLAYAYQRVGRIEDAMQSIDEYVRLAPNEPNPYDSRGDILLRQARLEEALAAFRRAISLHPDFYQSRLKVGRTLIYLERYDEAAAWLQQSLASPRPDERAESRRQLALIPAYQGRMSEAKRQLEAALQADRTEEISPDLMSEKLWSLSDLAKTVRDTLSRRRYLDELSRIFPSDTRIFWMEPLALLHAAQGRWTEADSLLSAIRGRFESTGTDEILFESTRAGLAALRGDVDAAIAGFERTIELEPDFYGYYHCGLVCFRTGRFREALGFLEKAADYYPRLGYVGDNVLVFYYLGRSLEEVGRIDEAHDAYATFLRIWKDADPTIPEVVDARQRFAAL